MKEYGCAGIGWTGVPGCIGRLGRMIHEILEVSLLYVNIPFKDELSLPARS